MNKVKVIKYNYSLDEEVQNYNYYEAFVQLSMDEQHLIITNKVKCVKDEYVLENDPEEIKK